MLGREGAYSGSYTVSFVKLRVDTNLSPRQVLGVVRERGGLYVALHCHLR